MFLLHSVCVVEGGGGILILTCDVRKITGFFEKAHNKKLILTCIPTKAAVKRHKMSTKHMMGVTDYTSVPSTFLIFCHVILKYVCLKILP